MKPTPTAELLAEAGRLLYGEIGWSGPLSEDLMIQQRTIQAWTSGKRDLMANNDVMQRLESLLREEAAELKAMADRIRESTAKAPPKRAPVRASA